MQSFLYTPFHVFFQEETQPTESSHMKHRLFNKYNVFQTLRMAQFKLLNKRQLATAVTINHMLLIKKLLHSVAF